jgi:hypothetical protein
MGQAFSLSPNGVSDNPKDYLEMPNDKIITSISMPVETNNDGYGFNLGTLFKGWELYNDTKATSVPTPQATTAGEKAGPNYLLIGVAAFAAILLLRR